MRFPIAIIIVVVRFGVGTKLYSADIWRNVLKNKQLDLFSDARRYLTSLLSSLSAAESNYAKDLYYDVAGGKKVIDAEMYEMLSAVTSSDKMDEMHNELRFYKYTSDELKNARDVSMTPNKQNACTMIANDGIMGRLLEETLAVLRQECKVPSGDKSILKVPICFFVKIFKIAKCKNVKMLNVKRGIKMQNAKPKCKI